MKLLQLPIINGKLFQRALTGIRPYRKSGIKVSVQQLFSKTIFHNYGHGGSGISLAPATAVETVSMMEISQIPRNKPIAILGSGIAGLTTALSLSKKGYQVNAYSAIIPDL